MIDDLVKDVRAEESSFRSAIVFIEGIKARLDAAIAAKDMKAVQQLSDELGANPDKLAYTIFVNTPHDPRP